VKLPVDFFTLAGHYVIDDLSAAGLPAEDRQRMEKPDVPVKDKFRAFNEYWRYAKSTGYGEALRIAIRDIYGIAEISERTIDRINAAIRERNKPGLYRDVLKKRSRIRYAINDEYWQAKPAGVDPEFFLLARKFDSFVGPITREGLQRLESLAEMEIPDLAALKRAMESHFAAGIKFGMVTAKSTIAYQRDLHFEITTAADAAADLQKLKRGEGVVTDEHQRLDRRPFRALSNHMFHHLVQLCEAHEIPMQIHTGMQAGNGNYIEHTQPSKLTNLFLRYPRAQFDVFHIGYPYTSEATALAKMFANVCVDYCWMHIISPSAARAALHEMLDSVPANKIFGFGGDYRYPELSYAHLVMAKRNITRVLAERVEGGACTEIEAVQTAKWLLHDNPARLFLKKN
jgi:hypothetical protein